MRFKGVRWVLSVAIAGGGALIGIAGYVAVRMARPPGPPDLRTSIRVSDVLRSGSEEGFARALEPRPFVFPADHGPHPAFRSEWWYLTGNLEGPGEEPFGFQVTFFRNALAPRPPGGESAWATNQVYMAHFALTDGEGETFRAYERFDRGALELAGARAETSSVPSNLRSDAPPNLPSDAASYPPSDAPSYPPSDAPSYPPSSAPSNLPSDAPPDPPSSVPGAAPWDSAQGKPFKVWLEDWVMEGPVGEPGVDGIFPLRLEAAEGDRAVSLLLRPEKPLVLQGDQGLSQKGLEPGNASFYYSFTRLAAEGTVTVGGQEVPVEGLAWLDREWSTSALSRDQVGWDWFALQLSDGRDLMYYQLRTSGGGPDPYGAGIFVGPEGKSRSLAPDEVELTVLDHWESPRGGIIYPSRWRIVVPTADLDLEVVPLLPDQELNLTFRYWEGAVRVDGTAGSSPVHGRGYVELTGYADAVGHG